MINPTLKAKADKLIDRANNEMSKNVARRYYCRVVEALEEITHEAFEERAIRVTLARIATTLQSEFQF